jgi:hypothetical protein
MPLREDSMPITYSEVEDLLSDHLPPHPDYNRITIGEES